MEPAFPLFQQPFYFYLHTDIHFIVVKLQQNTPSCSTDLSAEWLCKNLPFYWPYRLPVFVHLYSWFSYKGFIDGWMSLKEIQNVLSTGNQQQMCISNFFYFMFSNSLKVTRLLPLRHHCTQKDLCASEDMECKNDKAHFNALTTEEICRINN